MTGGIRMAESGNMGRLLVLAAPASSEAPRCVIPGLTGRWELERRREREPSVQTTWPSRMRLARFDLRASPRAG